MPSNIMNANISWGWFARLMLQGINAMKVKGIENRTALLCQQGISLGLLSTACTLLLADSLRQDRLYDVTECYKLHNHDALVKKSYAR